MKTLRIVSADMEAAEGLQTMMIRNKQFRVLPILRDGRELLERYMEERTDVLLIDLELPGIDGLEIVEAVSSLPILRRPQLFVMAGAGTSSVLERMGDEIDYCFLKPLDPKKEAAQLYALPRALRSSVHIRYTFPTSLSSMMLSVSNTSTFIRCVASRSIPSLRFLTFEKEMLAKPGSPR